MPQTPLKNREIVLGVTGSIAAYKAADLVRRFQEAGANVTCVMTTSAAEFITPLTLTTLSKRPVLQDMFDRSNKEITHVSLAHRIDAIVAAPCTAHLIAQLAAGFCGDLLTTLILASRVPVFLAPAMHEPMWLHPATKKNAGICRGYGYHLIGPVKGASASGEQGLGRLEEPVKIVEQVTEILHKNIS